MGWKAYRWVWRLESPLHVGIAPAGALQRCRLYVPARAVWGAMVSALARQHNDGELAKLLRDQVRFSYLFPAMQSNHEWTAWLPHFEAGMGLVWKPEQPQEKNGLPDRCFRQLLLHTRPSTAIDPRTDTAEEGSLRETEVILPRWREDAVPFSFPQGMPRPVGPVAMAGYVFVKSGTDSAQEVLDVNCLLVGGDTRYGLGRLVREGTPEPTSRCFGDSLKLDDPEGPTIVKPSALYAHGQGHAALTGHMECLRGWNTANMESEKVLYTPGSGIAGESPKNWIIQEDGTWKLSPSQR